MGHYHLQTFVNFVKTMSSLSISPRPTLEQIMAMVSFMEKHPELGLGKMKSGVEARSESKKLWVQLSRVLNSMSGPTRPVKSWIKFWSDKKSNVKIKVQSAGGDASSLMSNVERRIWDQFLSEESNISYNKTKVKRNVKEEPEYIDTENSFFDDNNVTENDMELAQNDDIEFEEQPIVNIEEREIGIMEKLVKVMGEQATAMTQLAQASTVNSQAMETLAESSQIQARALDRLASTFETICASTHDLRNAMIDIDATMKRFYPSPT